MLNLRPYQVDCLDAIEEALARGVNRPAVVKATGLGKTVTFSGLIERNKDQGYRFLVVVHRDELAQQAQHKIQAANPDLKVGIVKAGRNDVQADVIVASVQTIQNAKRRDQIRGVGFIIVDEAHHSAARTWVEILTHFGAFNGVPCVGFTATLARSDDLGLGDIWQEVVYTRDTIWGVRNGYLSDVRGLRIQVPQLDLSGIRIRSGDLQQDDVSRAMLNADTGGAIAKAVIDHAGDRHGIVFAPSVDTAVDFTNAIRNAGFTAETILGTTSAADRFVTYERFRLGKTQFVCNNLVLTEGFDAPWCDCVIVARPTKSPALYQQMIGRGLRIWKGKIDCLVLDVVGATSMHDLASLIDLSEGKPPREGQSLLEALDEYPDLDMDRPEDTGLPGFVLDADHSVVDHLHVTEVDLLAQSHSLWLSTRNGNMFIPVNDSFVYVYPWENAYVVGVTAKQLNAAPGPLLKAGLSLDEAIAWAEQVANEIDPEITQKNAPWRLQGKASAGQRRQGAMIGVRIPTSWTAAQAFDALSVELASRRIDR